MSAQEKLQNTIESGLEASESAAKQLEKLNNKPESAVELSPRDVEARAEKARHDALEKAVSVEAGGTEKDKSKAHTTTTRRGAISKQQLNKSYKQTIKHVQDELPTFSRGFSKLIHNPGVEKTSEVIGNTIARPNAILAGGFMAFILTLIVYVTAKNLGYNLSGFETIAAFTVGWFIGLAYDYIRLLVTGKNPN